MLGTAYQLPRARFSKVPKTFRFRKAIRKTPTRLFCKAGLFICCEGDKNHNNCKVSCLRRDAFFLKKRELSPEMYKHFRETGSRKRFEIQSSGQAISKGCLILLFSGAPFNGIHFTGSSVIFLFHSMRFLLSLSYTKLEAVSDNSGCSSIEVQLSSKKP